MSAMTSKEFVQDVQVNNNPDKSPQAWSLRAATAVMIIASGSDNLTSDEVLEAVQDLARALPIELLMGGMVNMSRLATAVDSGEFDHLL